MLLPEEQLFHKKDFFLVQGGLEITFQIPGTVSNLLLIEKY